MAFIDRIKAKAKQDKQAIVLPETKDKRTLIAAAQTSSWLVRKRRSWMVLTGWM